VITDGQCVPYACCADSQCGNGQTCVNHVCSGGGGGQPVCTVPSCCKQDDDCADTDRCDIPAGAETGRCVPVTGCGVVANHVLAEQWQCGGLQACPPCGSGYQCIGHQCIQGKVSAPSGIYVGRTTTIHAEMNGVSCANCQIIITDPNGAKSTLTTDQNGNLTIPLNIEGTYKATLVKDQQPLSTVAITSLKPPSVASTTPLTLIEGNEAPCLLAVLILLILFVLYMRWRAGRAKPVPKPGPSKPKAAPAKPL
jgi:hypothetical protein